MKFCNKCGRPTRDGEKFCSNCGNLVQVQNNNNVANTNANSGSNIDLSLNANTTIQPSKFVGLLIGIGSGFGVLIVIFLISMLLKRSSSRYYFDNNSNNNGAEIVNTGTTTTKKGKYKTAIIYDNTYSGVSISKDDDAYKLIEKDSVSQKDNCPSQIKAIENDIIKKYGITAVNLCEMDVGFAKEIGNVIKVIYEEYPSARGYITNLSLANVSMSDGYIAAFMPVFNFATSDSSTTYPWVIKTQVLLNTTYFLNKERLEASVKEGSDVGHFPPNATIYSPVAHELGHYLSFLAMMKNHQLNSILLVDGNNINTFYDVYSDFGSGDFSKQMIDEAFENYKKDTGNMMSLDEWRGTISQYALAKDNNGNYIWDETIAESFHDVYLNKKKASDASKYIVDVLKSKLKG